MKQLVFIVFFASLFFSCSKKDGVGGSIELLPAIDDALLRESISFTRSGIAVNNYTSCFVFLDGEEYKTLSFPANGVVDGLKAGNYSVTVSSHLEEPSPEFDSPYLKGNVATVKVTEGKTTKTSVMLRQVNAVLYFEYSEKLLTSELDYTPVVTHDAGTLVYSGENSQKKGYFPAGRVTIDIAGIDQGREIELVGGVSYNVKLDCQAGNDGLQITVVIIKVEEPTDTLEIGVI